MSSVACKVEIACDNGNYKRAIIIILERMELVAMEKEDMPLLNQIAHLLKDAYALPNIEWEEEAKEK